MDISKLIHENPGVNITVSGTDLLRFANDLATNTAREVMERRTEKYFTKPELKEILGNPSDATLWRWEKKGLLHGKLISGKKYYSETDIKNMMK